MVLETLITFCCVSVRHRSSARTSVWALLLYMYLDAWVNNEVSEQVHSFNVSNPPPTPTPRNRFASCYTKHQRDWLWHFHVWRHRTGRQYCMTHETSNHGYKRKALRFMFAPPPNIPFFERVLMARMRSQKSAGRIKIHCRYNTQMIVDAVKTCLLHYR